MKAAYFEKTGGPEVIQYGELPKPTPQTCEVLVRVGAAAYRTVVGREPDTATERRLGTLAHYAFGASAGAIYAVASDNLPALRIRRFPRVVCAARP